MPILLLAIGGCCCGTWHLCPVLAGDGGLSGAYSHAQSLVHSFRLQGMSSGGSSSGGSSASAANVLDTTWRPSFGASFSEPEPPSPTEIAIGKEIKARESRISKLTAKREAWRVALERLQSRQDWQKELSYWVEDSQTAQCGALQTSLGLLVGVGGPVANAIDARRYNAAALWNSAQNTRTRLEQVNLLLYEAKSPAQETAALRSAAAALRSTYDTLTGAMKSEAAVADQLQHLDQVGDKLLEAARYIELGKDLKEKHNLLLAAKLMEDFVVDLMKDAGLVRIQKKLAAEGMAGAGQTTRLASFAIDYGFHSLRFYLAWNNVHDILGQAENAAALSATLGQRIAETTDQITKLRGEIKRFDAARSSKTEQEKVLAECRQKDMREAWMAGEWFSQQTGFRAAGEPILDR